ncbi:hypothetical protein [Pseudomonas sp. EL_65y_Pfl1_R32]|uniref:hypothetical protein n=1 Tax=Pseudomonas sp. EL_65y_Pfl1_R32 TaxID=3088696 RepID=UPI0030D7D009
MIFGEDRRKITSFVDEFKCESDRGCAVLVLCVLEDLLIETVKHRLPVCSNEELRSIAPLGRLSNTVSNAFLIGAISRRERDEFSRLIKIRNKFAHKALEGLSFSNPDIIDMCKKLELADVFDEFSSDAPRIRFNISALIVYCSLHTSLSTLDKLGELEARKHVLQSYSDFEEQ